MKYTRKTKDIWILYADYGYGYGWEEVLTEETRKEARGQLRTYRENMPQYPYKIVKKREKLQPQTK